MIHAHIESIKSLTIAAFVSATSMIMLLSMTGLNGAPFGQLIV